MIKENKIENYIGKKINSVTVVGLDFNYIGRVYNANHWIFRCECGNEFSCAPSRVLSGHKKSCGCKRYTGAITHGLNGDEFYHTWYSMMQRCYNPKHHNYHSYGARGIFVCEEWHDPQKFIEWARTTIGKKDRNLTVDRIDNNGPYSPENCRWATPKEQSRNRRNTRYGTMDGITKPLTEWCEEYNIYPETVMQRMESGMDFKSALTHPTGFESISSFIIEIDGVKKNVTEWCKIFGTSRNTAYGRIKRGLDPIEAVSKPPRKPVPQTKNRSKNK